MKWDPSRFTVALVLIVASYKHSCNQPSGSGIAVGIFEHLVVVVQEVLHFRCF
jgi:hypothetical protein